MFSRAECNLIFCETKTFGGLHTIAEHPPGFVAQLLRHTRRTPYEARLASVGVVVEHHHHDPSPLPARRLPKGENLEKERCGQCITHARINHKFQHQEA